MFRKLRDPFKRKVVLEFQGQTYTLRAGDTLTPIINIDFDQKSSCGARANLTGMVSATIKVLSID